MVEIVTGTPSVVGFTNGHDDHGNHHYHSYGLTDKDQQFAVNIDANERTRDILDAIANGITAVEKTGAANGLATEKVGAAAVLASEKNAAALHVQIANAASASAAIAAANQQAAMMYANTNASAGILFAAQNQATLTAQIAECCCDIKRDIADVKATILSVDAGRIRDELNRAQSELLAIRYSGGVAVPAAAIGNNRS